MQVTLDCSTSKLLSIAILCYDKSRNIVVDEYTSDSRKTGAAYFPDNAGSVMCDMYRMKKKDLTK